MRPRFSISFRHGGHRVYACDINRNDRITGRYGTYYRSVRVASLPMNADDRADAPTPSYALKLLAWHERRDMNTQSLQENRR